MSTRGWVEVARPCLCPVNWHLLVLSICSLHRVQPSCSANTGLESATARKTAVAAIAYIDMNELNFAIRYDTPGDQLMYRSGLRVTIREMLVVRVQGTLRGSTGESWTILQSRFAYKEVKTCAWCSSGTLMAARSYLYYFHASKIWLQNTRYQNAAILLLVVFHQSNYETWGCACCAIESVNKYGANPL